MNKVHWSEAPLVETEPEILVSLTMEQYPKYVNFDSYVEQLRKGPESLFDVTIRCSSGKTFKVEFLNILSREYNHTTNHSTVNTDMFVFVSLSPYLLLLSSFIQ